jgi:tRNA-specific 2-thiouridylase
LNILLLFSGGLDSILSYYILKENRFYVDVVQFYTPFLGIKNERDYQNYYLEKFNISIELIDIFEDYKYILTNPAHGYGKNLNPCLDCKLLFYKKAKEIFEMKVYNYIATGEVVGQRPFSQMSNSLNFLENQVQLKGKILRPLSYQKSARIEGKNFFELSGRGRKPQIKLAKSFGINVKEVTPAGGCLLTDPLFAEKCRKIINFFNKEPEKLKREFFEIIKFGRIINRSSCTRRRNKIRYQRRW